MPDEDDFDLLTLRQIKQVAEQQPQPYRVRAQVESCGTREAANGKPFYEVKLTDGTESMIWRIFDGTPAFGEAASLQRGTWIELGAHWTSGKFGVEPRNAGFRVLNAQEVQVVLAGDAQTMERQRGDFEAIAGFVSSMTDPRLGGVCRLFLELHEERFKRAAAARDYHHARRGGLVEHVAQMMRCAGKICEAYPALNRDLLLAGVLFHDCGKLWENNYAEGGFVMPYNLHGEMIGHIALGLELVNKLWRQLMESDDAKSWMTLEPASELVRVHLLHLIGSHHGEMQFGSPVLPKTPEAMVLHHVDNIDAKLEMLRRAYDTSASLGNGIHERVRPLSQNLVEPLAAVPAAPSAQA